MPESAPLTLVILLSSILGVLVLLLVLGILSLRRLGRIERSLRGNGNGKTQVESELAHSEVSSGSAFESFLNEDPARRQLPKGEQFAEYRRWRQEKGLNWSKS